MFADEVMAITEWREPARLPHAPASILGVVSIRGRMLTVLDLSQMLESQQRTESPSHILALNGDDQLALAIAAVGETLAIDPATASAAVEDVGGGKLIAGVIDCNGDEIRILNVKELFPTAIQGRDRRRRRF